MEEEKREPEVFRAASLVVRDENSKEVTLYALGETRLNGCPYILAVDSKKVDEGGACYLLKDVFSTSDAKAVYEFVENGEEAGYMLEIFQTTPEDGGADTDLPDE